MKPIDIRNATWLGLQDDLSSSLRDIYQVWVSHGPGTTRAVAERSGREILTLRPRTTDLYHVGLVELVGTNAGEGIYRARIREAWEDWKGTQPCVATGAQIVAL